jgi:diguanylate cyclase
MTKILVIEDEESIRTNLLETLTEENFTAIGAKNGREGIALAETSLPNLILCDVMMPEFDGYEVLKSIQNNPKTATIPFIFLTALGEKNDLRKGMNSGADDYLSKPYSIDELLQAIESRLARQTAMSQSYTKVLDKATEKLNRLTSYDRLTKLPERIYLQEEFEKYIARLNLNSNSPEANSDRAYLPILCIGLDRLDIMAETLGYVWQDLLIKAIAGRLQKCLVGNNIISRINNDEFAILLTTVNNKQELNNIAKDILETLAQPYFVERGQEILLVPSIGVSLYPHHGKDLEKLLPYASQTMKIVRQQGGNFYDFHRTNYNPIAQNRIALETSLYHAIEREELELHYQPRINIETREIVGAEALIRWNHPTFGLLPPDKFIAIAEETNLIVPIGEWVLRTACEKVKTWQQAGASSFRIAVNLSLRQLHQLNFQSVLFDICRSTGLKSQYIDLELTETIFLQQPEAMAFRLRALKTTGVKIAIDDFGKGYSSLLSLKQLPFDILKIDRCFVHNIDRDPTNQAIVAAIVQMANQLNLDIIAEGVETPEELAFLRQQNCREVQGYLFSHPLKASEFEKLLFSNRQSQMDTEVHSK